MHVQTMIRHLIAAPRRLAGAVVVLAIALALPSPAAAALTAAEATAIQRPFSAARNLAEGISAELLPVINETNSSTRPRLAQVAQLINKAQGQVAGGLADLLGGSYDPDDTRGRNFFVQRAAQQLTGAYATLGQVKAATNAAISAGANSYHMGRLRDIHIAAAMTNLKAFDATLGYENPYPEGRSPDGRILVIGPHGDYAEAQVRLNSAITFLLQAASAVITAYGSDSLLPSYWNLYQQIKFARTLYQENVEAMGALAGVTYSASEAARNPFFRMLARIETLTHGGGGPTVASNHCSPDTCHGTPYNYMNFVKFTMDQMPYWSGRPNFAANMQVALRRISEAWDGTDSAVWFILAFPECDQKTKPAGCGGTGK